MHTRNLGSVFPGINRSQTADLWNSGSTGPAAPSSPVRGWVLLSLVLRPPPMSLSDCRLSQWPSCHKAHFPTWIWSSVRARVWSPEPRFGWRSLAVCARCFSLCRGSPVPWSLLRCVRVAELCPRKQCWFNLCFSSSCQAVPASPPCTRQGTRVCKAAPPRALLRTWAEKLCIKTHVHMFSFPDIFWKI